MSSQDAVIVDVVRTGTGKGKPGGALSGIHPVDLLASTLRSLLDRNGVNPTRVEDVIAGCVTQTGEQAANIARQAVLAAGWPEDIPATTVDRQCGSSQQALHFAAQGVLAGAYDVVVAAGVESMSRVPMLSSVGTADPYGAALRARYPKGLVPQGISAELIAARWGLDRAALDAYAAGSHQRAAHAAEQHPSRAVVPIDLPDGSRHTHDEPVRPGTTTQTLAGLRPAFHSAEWAERFPEIGWSITPGNSSPLTDGASAALVMSAERARRLGLTPRARFHSFAVTGSDPLLMLTGVIPATRQVLRRAGLDISDLDAYEVNEAFAPVPLVWAREVGADPERLNVHGGAIASGHPLGATGGKLLATLLDVLQQRGGRYGLQTVCEGGGMANAMIIERL